ncbi:uncharacterized protein TNCV_3106941 [Trichonephila clavipes]|nr:uncharacterized protein TNCV_3106941 [Trichonephila clavipes]
MDSEDGRAYLPNGRATRLSMEGRVTRKMKHRSRASRIPSTIQSPSRHLAECKTTLSPCPSSKTCPDMGLRTVLAVQKPKKATPINSRLLRQEIG